MLRSFAFAGTLLLSLTVPALADVATTDGLFVNIRSGPGTNHPVICLAWPGVRFTVTECGGNWCAVQYRRTTGWISANHISFDQ